MKHEFTKALWFLAALGITYLLDKISGPARDVLIQISPLSIWRLGLNEVKALGLTLTAAVVAWISGVGTGYVLGHIVGLVSIHKRSHRSLRWLSRVIQESYNIIYIIPLVITLSLAYALLMYYNGQGAVPKWGIVAGSIAVSGIALGGYQVFKTVVGAVDLAGDQRLFLTKTLFSKYGQSTNSITPYFRSFSIVRRLAAFEVRQFIKSLEIAFHLAVVGVIILETITPSIYEHIFPQSGITPAWTGGVGRLILRAQSNFEFQDIAGMLWAVVVADFIVVVAANLFAQYRWLRYYRS